MGDACVWLLVNDVWKGVDLDIVLLGVIGEGGEEGMTEAVREADHSHAQPIVRAEDVRVAAGRQGAECQAGDAAGGCLQVLAPRELLLFLCPIRFLRCPAPSGLSAPRHPAGRPRPGGGTPSPPGPTPLS